MQKLNSKEHGIRMIKILHNEIPTEYLLKLLHQVVHQPKFLISEMSKQIKLTAVNHGDKIQKLFE